MDQPPFDPPFLTRHPQEAGEQLIFTAADGSTATLGSAAGRWVDIAAAPAPATASGSVGNSAGKTYLKVPFAEKDEAKALGARWDAARKKWYAPPGADLAQFARWTA